MENLPELLDDIPPIDETTFAILERLPDETLAVELERLHERFLDIGGRIIAINEIRSAE